MQSAGYEIREKDPFKFNQKYILKREISPYVNRMRILWHQMRKDIISRFPKPPNTDEGQRRILKR